MTVGEKIKRNRIALDWTQQELSKKLAISKKTLSMWEHGNVYSIPLSKIQLMATLFNITPSFLIEDDRISQK